MNSEQTQLTLVQRTINVPGCQLNLRGLVIDENVSKDALIKVGSHLGAVSGVLQWAWADFLAALSDHTCGGADDSEVLARYCDEHAIPAKRKKELLLMARYYPHADRSYPLPYEYYREAFLIPKGAKSKSLLYLSRADSEQLSLGEFRRYMRKAEADTTPSATQSVFRDYTVVYDFAKFAKVQLDEEIDNYSRERAQAVLADLTDVVRYISKLREIAGESIDVVSEKVSD